MEAAHAITIKEVTNMNKRIFESYNGFFDERIDLCRQREAAFSADSRNDEANFEKIRANVYGIFKTVLGVTASAPRSDDEARLFFNDRLEKIPQSWHTAYEKAVQHDEVSKLTVERIKLDTVEDIKRAFEEIWSE